MMLYWCILHVITLVTMVFRLLYCTSPIWNLTQKKPPRIVLDSIRGHPSKHNAFVFAYGRSARLSEDWPCVCTHMCKSARGLTRARSWVESAKAAVSPRNNHSPPICLLPDTFSLFSRRITFYMICSINLSTADNNSSLIRALAILAVPSEPFCETLFSCHPAHTFNGLLMSYWTDLSEIVVHFDTWALFATLAWYGA